MFYYHQLLPFKGKDPHVIISDVSEIRNLSFNTFVISKRIIILFLLSGYVKETKTNMQVWPKVYVIHVVHFDASEI